MLSILIPIYNQDVTNLVKILQLQCNEEDFLYEIRCLDDGSDRSIRKLNKNIGQLPNVHYREVAINVGRSRIRNLLAQDARYDQLLFIDCDSVMIDDSFIHNYLERLPVNHVLVGGRVYSEKKPEPEFLLHWLVGTRREQRLDSGFQSNNFIIPRRLFNQIKFSEEVTGYGHEDTLFGYMLSDMDIEIEHVYNPVMHGSLEPAEAFVNKQENAIDNLLRLLPAFPDLQTRLTELARKVENRMMSAPMIWSFQNLGPRWKRKLMGTSPSLFYLDLYKLGYYLTRKSEMQQKD